MSMSGTETSSPASSTQSSPLLSAACFDPPPRFYTPPRFHAPPRIYSPPRASRPAKRRRIGSSTVASTSALSAIMAEHDRPYRALSNDERTVYGWRWNLLFRSLQDPIVAYERHALRATHHPVSADWNKDSPLSTGIMALLRTEHLRAVSFFGTYRQDKAWGPPEKDLSTTLVIFVAPRKITPEQAHEIGMACLKLLREHSVLDIHVEMIEADWGPRRNILNDDPVKQALDSNRERWPSSQFLGTSISPMQALHSQGTKGIHLRLTYPSGETKIVAVSCRHVTWDESMKDNAPYSFKPGDPKKEVIQPGDGTLREMIEWYEDRICLHKILIKTRRTSAMLRHIKDCDAEERELEGAGKLDAASMDRISTKRDEVPQCYEADRLQTQINEMQTKLPMFRNWLNGDPRERIIGHILSAPSQKSITHHDAQGNEMTHFRDYVVIELDQAAYKMPLDELANNVPGSDYGQMLINHVIRKKNVQTLETASSPRQIPVGMESEPLTDTFRPHGILTMAEMLRPDASAPPWLNVPSGDQDKAKFMVAKFGATSGFTVGFVNGAIVRTRHITDADAVASRESASKDKHATHNTATMSSISATSSDPALGRASRIYDSTEICVVRPQCNDPVEPGRIGNFTRPGDSGSAVFNCITGQWVGMATFGFEAPNEVRSRECEEEFAIDVTCLTTFDWLLMDVEKELGCKAEII